MHDRARRLIEELRLEPHPEGGHYRETFRSTHLVRPADFRPARCALTAIYFLLARGQISRWHSVRSDEAWNFLEGGPLALSLFDIQTGQLTKHTLGPYGPGAEPVITVPAGLWQAAEPLDDFCLVSCMVAPGFEFDDFTLAADDPAAAAAIRSKGNVYGALL
jgi:predicted cupin superfamily sugar epimerase